MNSIRFRKIDIFVFGLIFFFAAILSGCDQSGKKEAGVPGRNLATSSTMEVQKPHLVSDLILGRKVFEAKNCNQCHSIFER
jgi:cytochrome c5